MIYTKKAKEILIEGGFDVETIKIKGTGADGKVNVKDARSFLESQGGEENKEKSPLLKVIKVKGKECKRSGGASTSEGAKNRQNAWKERGVEATIKEHNGRFYIYLPSE